VSISVQHLSRQYGQQLAVNNISFQVNKGEIVGFLGPNGAGKSTTMKMLTGSIEPSSGQMEICGIPVLKNSVDTKAKIGYLPEANPLYPEMYVREYLEFVASIHQIDQKTVRLQETIALVGLQSEAHKKIGQLSKGYKQRVGLAAALIHNPEVLILDEPTSGLDPNQMLEIREVIKQLGQHKTILFSSHIMQEVEAICERVIIIHQGNIVADNTVQQLKKGVDSHHFVTVEFEETIPSSLLSSMKGCTAITNLSANQFKIETDQPEQVKKQLLEISLQSNLNIVSLHSQKQDLEEVFTSLTH
jgi:ABC-2 type transport system ATP-binding protein